MWWIESLACFQELDSAQIRRRLTEARKTRDHTVLQSAITDVFFIDGNLNALKNQLLQNGEMEEDLFLAEDRHDFYEKALTNEQYVSGDQVSYFIGFYLNSLTSTLIWRENLFEFYV